MTSDRRQFDGLASAISARRGELARLLDVLDRHCSSADLGEAVRAVERPSAYQSVLSGRTPEAALQEISQWIAELPPPMLGPASAPSTLRIAIVADGFFYSSFRGLVDLVPITPNNYAAHLDDVDVFLVVSTWKGVDGKSWQGLANPDSGRRRRLITEVIPAFRKAGVPVLFYSKEDPPNYERFLDIAKACDIIFTSAVECVARYRKDCPHVSRIDVLPFGVNPLVHTPVGSRPGRSSLLYFAGSWLPEKYPLRTREGEILFDGVLASGRDLCLIDRYSSQGGTDPRYAYPPKYAPFLAPEKPHDFLLELQRVTDIGLNLNSVLDSQTMFANRVIELQASGVVVLSTYNMGVNSRYPWVHIANTVEDVARTLEEMTFEEMRHIQAKGIREVFLNDHALARIDAISEAVGISAPRRTLTAVAVSGRPTDELATIMSRQSLGKVPLMSLESYRASDVDADFVLPVDPAYNYSVDYAADFAAAFCYADADVVAKSTLPLDEADRVSHRFLDEPIDPNSSAWWTAGRALPHRGFVPDPEGRVYGLDAVDIAARSRDRAELRAQVRTAPQQPLLSVIVPAYNNGDHLVHKCYASLRRSSIWNRTEVVVVDDGSTDARTIERIQDLAANDAQVTTYFFHPGGSGSASRPRNKGLELARGEYVTYLDPDDEMVNDGYARLVRALEDTGASLAVGDMTLWRRKRSLTRARDVLEEGLDSATGATVPGGAEALLRTRFKPLSIEAMAARTRWLRDLQLEQPVGAVGQDTFFYQQALLHAETVAIVDETVYAYYGAVDGSIINSASARYFQKYLLLEQARTRWLRESGLMDAYRQARLDHTFRNWYLKKLALVPADQHAEASAVLRAIAALYEPHDWKDAEVRGFLDAVTSSAIS